MHDWDVHYLIKEFKGANVCLVKPKSRFSSECWIDWWIHFFLFLILFLHACLIIFNIWIISVRVERVLSIKVDIFRFLIVWVIIMVIFVFLLVNNVLIQVISLQVAFLSIFYPSSSQTLNLSIIFIFLFFFHLFNICYTIFANFKKIYFFAKINYNNGNNKFYISNFVFI